ncbi:hypothetical protein [Phaeobacter sp. J2-8]|uniref:hypothetical protein n=1 Tax=Phaeobacter sp. J2-8 TaxID=2931394 RepID=UPI001FD2067B|nr:hypothetical protein [Phaeobacter sp. J2-8]MCJ7871492.1 hypothetical protein [Phaeobacter sp. J2-8]
MTFIIGKKFSPGNIRVFSDIKLTGPNGERLPPKEGTLKIWLPVQDLAIAFAGNVEAPKELWSCIKGKFEAGIHWNEILQLTQHIAKNYDHGGSQGAEFIVSSIRGAGTLAKVTAQEILEDQGSCWIGDIEAFEKFQGKFHSAEGAAISDLAERTDWAFAEFISDGGVESAGHFYFSVRVEYHKNGRPYFDYDLRASTMAGLAPVTIELAAGEWTNLALGGAEDGISSVSTVRSLPGEYTGAGLYFSEGKFGFFFCPTLGVDALVYKDVDPSQFLQKVSERLGVQVGGFISSGSGIQRIIYPSAK